MRVQSDVKAAEPLPAESSGSNTSNALIHAACAGSLGTAAWIGARAIGIDPGLFTLGLGIGLGEEDTETKANTVAVHGLLYMGVALIARDWSLGVTAVGSLIAGMVGGEGIARAAGIDRIARKSIGGGIGAGAGSVMLIHWASGSGGIPTLDPIFVGLLGSVIAWGISREADPRFSEQKPATDSQAF